MDWESPKTELLQFYYNMFFFLNIKFQSVKVLQWYK